MPKAVYQDIYLDLKRRIEEGGFAYGSFLPSESELTTSYACSRSSIRRALGQLASDGYVQSQQGKGVRVIRDPQLDVTRGYDGFETFMEMAERLGFDPHTRCLALENVTADEQLAGLTGFPVGTRLIRALRARYAGDQAVSTDDSYILADLASGLTPELLKASMRWPLCAVIPSTPTATCLSSPRRASAPASFPSTRPSCARSVRPKQPGVSFGDVPLWHAMVDVEHPILLRGSAVIAALVVLIADLEITDAEGFAQGRKRREPPADP